ncbi:hypothetical protein [Halalkalirubrum salinum]|uniref:hypothetical protein n=1 Tax=Halalkalirubrum salinum TaxID=2563889 RepID=UPI0010FB5C64|nr:hypothetical protein [Halalkalirubrum salinum]
MHRWTRYTLWAIGIIVVGLLALGALPGLTGSGPTYHLTVETTTDDGGEATNVTDVSERRYPYLVSALEAEDGQSDGYQRGLGGLKDAFTHSPFDEFDSLTQQTPDAARDDGDRVLVEHDGQYYLVSITEGT